MKLLQSLLLVAATTVGLASSVRAASIEIYVRVAGYSQWPRVVPSANTGGRVVYSAAHRRYITDRVSRGESYTALLTLARGEKPLFPGTPFAMVAQVPGSGLSPRQPLPPSIEVWGGVVPAAGPLTVTVTTGSGLSSSSLPIGTRPR